MTAYEKLSYFRAWATLPCTCQGNEPLCLSCEAANTLVSLQRIIHQRYEELAARAEASKDTSQKEPTP